MENNDGASLYGNAPYSSSSLPSLPNTRDPQLNPSSIRHVDTPLLHAGRMPSDPFDQLPMTQHGNAIYIWSEHSLRSYKGYEPKQPEDCDNQSSQRDDGEQPITTMWLYGSVSCLRADDTRSTSLRPLRKTGTHRVHRPRVLPRLWFLQTMLQ